VTPLRGLKNGVRVVRRKVIALDIKRNFLVGSDLAEVGQVSVDGQRQSLDILTEVLAPANPGIDARVRVGVQNDLERFSVHRKDSAFKFCASVTLGRFRRQQLRYDGRRDGDVFGGLQFDFRARDL